MAGDSLGGAGSGLGDLPEINASVPHPARVYNHFLGGTDNFEAVAASRPVGGVARKPGQRTAAALAPGVARAPVPGTDGHRMPSTTRSVRLPRNG